LDLKLLEELCLSGGPSGFEDEVMGIVMDELKDHSADLNIDVMGNITGFKKGESYTKTKLLLSAHMDEVGFIVNYITDDGFLKFSTIGGISPLVLCGKKVLVGKNKIPGVIGLKPVHLVKQKDECENVPNADELCIDVGAKDREDAENSVNIGDFAVFDSIFQVQGSSIISKALDDRVGCALLVEFIKKKSPFDFFFSFSAQEEIGLRGAKAASYRINPDAAIVLEATTACDILGVKDEKKVCVLGDGPVLTYMDKTTVYSREYLNLANNLAKENKVKVQMKRLVSGGNDSGAIHVSRSGIKTISISLPCRYLHSAFSVIDLEDLKETERLLQLLFEAILR
jgi:endoglucanase